MRRASAAAGRARDRLRALPGGTIAVRVVVTLVGAAVIALGIVLLPLPGPGWLIIFAGLGILATEYPWAARLLRLARHYVLAWTLWLRRQRPLVGAAVGLGGLVLVAGILALCWWLVT